MNPVPALAASWVVAKLTFRECTRRKVFLILPIATVGFIGLFALGTHHAFDSAASDFGDAGRGPFDTRVLIGATLLGLSMFVTMFLGSTLGIFLTMSAIRGDAEQGLLQPLVVRPVARYGLLLGRFLAASVLCVAYVMLLYWASVLIVSATGNWSPPQPLLPALSLAGGVVIVIALSLLGSALMPALANGIVMFIVYGGGLLAGLLGQLGEGIGSESLETTGRVTSWILPFEALYQAGLYSLTADTGGLTRFVVQLGPLGGAQESGIELVLWSLFYAAAVGATTLALFTRRDL
ncbi:MAG TPA: hypothetical protein VNC78_04015 [Actinomycetota bacterium]|nr:hypothetical protein [Actinomycetota bacterium]